MIVYLRKSKKPNGRTYLTIVQGYRDEDGKNKARTVRSLGYVDALEAEFDDPVAHFEEECRRMTEEAARAQAPVTVEFSAARKIDKRSEGRVELGAAVPSAYLHRDLGVWSFFERKRTSRGFSYDPCRILELLVVSVNIIFTIFTNVFSPIAPTRMRRIRQRGCAAFGA